MLPAFNTRAGRHRADTNNTTADCHSNPDADSNNNGGSNSDGKADDSNNNFATGIRSNADADTRQ